jgi:hypothetical protein
MSSPESPWSLSLPGFAAIVTSALDLHFRTLSNQQVFTAMSDKVQPWKSYWQGCSITQTVSLPFILHMQVSLN